MHKVIQITAVPVNSPPPPNNPPPPVDKAKHYRTQSTNIFCSSCQTTRRTQVRNLSHAAILITSATVNPPAEPSHKIIKHKALLNTADPVKPSAETKSHHYHTQSTTNYCSSCQSTRRNQVKILS